MEVKRTSEQQVAGHKLGCGVYTLVYTVKDGKSYAIPKPCDCGARAKQMDWWKSQNSDEHSG